MVATVTNMLIAWRERFLAGIPPVQDERSIHPIYVILFYRSKCRIDVLLMKFIFPSHRNIDMPHPQLISTPCVWLSLLSLSPSLHAQTSTGTSYPPVQVVESPLEYRQFDKVEITGSSIVRKAQTQALPVQVYTREELFRSGLRTVAEVLQKLPEMGQMVESGQLTQIVGNYSAASIHGLPNGTLVLVNGLRVAPFGRPTMVGPERSSVDLNTLPMADLDRIEILTDGASSLYGTDAIAGVVNIILRQERRGFEITADKTMPKGGVGQSYNTSLSWGAGEVRRDGYSFLVTAELAQKNELSGADRAYASPGRYTFEQDGKTWVADGPFRTNYTSPAMLQQRATPTSPMRRSNVFYQDGQCIANTLKLTGQPACAQTAYADLGIYPEEDSKRLHARGQWALQNATVFADLLYGQQQSSIGAQFWSASWSDYGQPVGSPGYKAAQAAGLDPANTLLLWRPNLPPIRERHDIENGRVSVGIKGEWNDWSYQSSAYLAQNKATILNQAPSGLFYDSLGLGAWGNWTRPEVLQPLTAGNPLRDELFAFRGDYKALNRGRSDLHAMELRASRALGEIDGKDVLLGVGLDGRKEFLNYEQLNNETLFQQPSFKTSRNIYAAYAELQIPVTADFEINGALRSDKYSDVGTTNNGKLSTRWAITPQWAVRGSVGTGFRAPSLAQVNETANPFSFAQADVQLACNSEQQKIAANLKTETGASGQCFSMNPVVFGNGNSQLRPETSKQESLGLAFVPHANLRLALDLWRVRINDTIRFISEAAILGDPLRYASNYMLMPQSMASQGYTTGDLALYTKQVNVGRSEKSGLDMEIQWRQPTDWGRFNLSAKATYMLRSNDQADATSEQSSDIGRFNAATGTVTPRVQARITGGLTNGAWSTTLVLQHVSGYLDASVLATDVATGTKELVGGKPVRSFTTLDAFASWAIQRNVSLHLGVRNVFDQDAPQTFASSSIQVFGANTRYANLWGRTLQLGMTARF